MKNKIITIILIIIFVAILLGINVLLNSNNMQKTENNKNVVSKVIEITAEDFEKEVLQSEKIVLIDFYADWCEPCKILEPTINEISSEYDDIKVVRINIDNEEELAYQYQIMSIPTLVVIENGEEKDRVIGVVEKQVIREMLGK